MHSPPQRGLRFAGCARESEETGKSSSAGLPRIPRQPCNAQCDVRHRCAHDRTPEMRGSCEPARYIGRKYRLSSGRVPCCTPHPPACPYLDDALSDRTRQAKTKQASPSIHLSRPPGQGVAPAGSRAEVVAGRPWCAVVQPSSRPHRRLRATPSLAGSPLS